MEVPKHPTGFPTFLFLQSLLLLAVLPLVGTATAGCLGQTNGYNYLCGETITQSCTMNEDLTTSLPTCFTVGANNITLTGGGHRITTSYVPPPGDFGGSGILLSGGREKVTITGFTVKDFYFGIKLSTSSSSTVTNNTVTGADFGIALYDSTANTVSDNMVTASNYALYLNSSAHGNTFSGNQVTGCSTGIRGFDSNNNRIEGNQVSDSTFYGIGFSNSQNTIITGNTATGNGWDGIYLYRAPGSVIEHNQSLDNDYFGIDVNDCSDNIIRYNLVSGNGDAGIHLAADSSDNRLIGNTSCDNIGVDVHDIHDEGDSNIGSANTCATVAGFTDSGDGVSGCTYSCGCGCDTGKTVFQCGETITSSCTMNCDLISFGNCFTINRTDDLVIEGNQFKITGNGTGRGISAAGTTGVAIKNFNLANFATGISLTRSLSPTLKPSTGNQLLGNRLKENTVAGISLSGSTANTIRGNFLEDGATGMTLPSGAGSNSLENNTAARNSGDGIIIGSSNNTLTNNVSCASTGLDINNNGTGNSGTNSTCDDTGGTYSDTGTTGCTNECLLCTDGTFFNQCSLQQPKYCLRGQLIDDCEQCGCASGTCNVVTGICEETPPPSGVCLGATKSFACGDQVTESCTLTDHMIAEGDCFIVTADNVTIDGAGFSITGNKTSRAVTTDNHDRLQIKDLTVTNFHTGIRLSYAGDGVIENCTIVNNEGPGISLTNYTTGTTVRNNTISHNDQRGIFMNYFSSGNTISNNMITDNKRGVYIIDDNTGNTLSGNTITNNQFYGLYIGHRSNNNTVSGNLISANTEVGLNIYRANNNTFSNNYIRFNPEEGVVVYDTSTGNTFNNNFITDNGGDGVYFGDATTNNQLLNNSICYNGNSTTVFDIDDDGTNTGSGNMCISTQDYDDTDDPGGGCARVCADCGCDTDTVIYYCGDTVTQSCELSCDLSSRDTCLTIGADGITIDGGEKGYGIYGSRQFDSYGIKALQKNNLTLKNLKISGYYSGIYFEQVSGSRITGSTMQSNDFGAFLAVATGNEVTDNSFNGNTTEGLRLTRSNTNTVKNNSFHDNGVGIQLLFNPDNNTISNNDIRRSIGNGIYLDYDANGNNLLANTVYGNGVDIYQDGTNQGTDNRCDIVHNWNDTGKTGCTFAAVAAGDVNADEEVDLEDIVLSLQAISDMNPAGLRAPRGDADGDRAIGLAEALHSLKAVADDSIGK